MSDNYGLIYRNDTLCTIPTPPTPLPDSQGGYYCTDKGRRYINPNLSRRLDILKLIF